MVSRSVCAALCAPRALSFLGVLAAAAPAAAQPALACEPPSVQLRPGQSACFHVRTTPTPLAGVTVQAVFNAAHLSVTPASATTGPSGELTFVVRSTGTNLTGAPLTFRDVSAVHQSCTAVVVCALPGLHLGGVGGSYPGTLALELTTTAPVNPGTLGAILLGPTPGPIPMQVLNPGDPRLFSVGALGLTLLPGHLGPFLPPFTRFAGASFPVPVLAARGLLYVQGMTIDPSQALVFHRLSQPQPMHLAPADSFWNRGAMLQLPRSFFPTVVDDDGQVWALGGGQGAIFAQMATRQVEYYDQVADRWVTHPVGMTSERSLHTATRLQNGLFLLTGGVNSMNDPVNTAELFDPKTGLFTAVGSMSTPRMGHSATLLPNGDVLVAGGLSVVSADIFATINSAQDTTERFVLDASGCNGSFVPGPRMTRPRAAHGVLELPDGRMLFSGGVGPLVIIIPIPQIWTQTELFNGSSFTAGPSMPTARAIFATTPIGNNRYLFSGGLSSVLGLGAPTSAADVYTFSAGNPGSWARAGNMSQPSGMQGAVRRGDEVIHFGGLQGDLVTPVALDVTEVYHIPTGTWRNGPRMSTPRGAYGWYVDAYGKVHLLGGAAGVGPNPPVVATTDLYFP